MGVAYDEMAALTLNNSGKLNLFSLTGYLNLSQKKSLFKGRPSYKQYWFWFDEKSCCLKYYKNQTTYLQSLNDPIGTIDLRCAKVTPGIAAPGASADSRTFHISDDKQNYILQAKDADSALTWIQKLQEKRGEYIKVSSAMQETAFEHDRGRHTLQPSWTTPVGALANQTHSRVRETRSISPPTVRKIVSSQLTGGSDSRHSMGLELDSTAVKGRRATVDVFLSRPSPKSEETVVDVVEDSKARETSPGLFDEDDLPRVMEPDERKRLELEMSCLQAQNEVIQLQKENRTLKDNMMSREDEIDELKRQVATLKEELIRKETPESDLRSENDSLKNIVEQYKRSLKTLNDEIELHKFNQKEHERRINVEKLKAGDLERELSNTKAKYVRLLSDKFKISVPSAGASGAQEIDPDDAKYKSELWTLMQQEGGENPEFDSYRTTFVDQYGDYHDWQEDTITQHYLCRQLYLHYKQQETESFTREWSDYLSNAKRVRNKAYIEMPAGAVDRLKKRDLRDMIRKGVPLQHRTQVWTSLIYHYVGKLKDIRDAACGGISYYQSLLKSKAAVSKPSEKQIKLDLYRTLPNNRHFKPGGAGAEKLERVLLAYSMHNKNVGYCQGMNMVAAIGLLFLDEETDFWFMVTLIEKLLPPGYFTPGLLAAQADQAVVRDLVAEKLPRLNAHLKDHSIDVTLVTFNWFLTLFVDALPTDTVLRILDCFLLEGHKLLFRVSLGILKLNEGVILSKTDPVTLFQFLKEIARHCFDIDAVFQAAFVEIVPFPNRSNISSRHNHHLAKVKQQWTAREKERKANTKKENKKKAVVQTQSQLLISTAAYVPPTEEAPRVVHYVWECGCVGGEGELWMCSGERQHGTVGIVTMKENEPQLEILQDKVSSRVICCHYVPSCQVVLLGTLDFIIQAIDCKARKEAWSLKMKDSILDITGSEEGVVYAALADGSVAVFKDVCTSPPESDPLLLYIGSSPVPCVVLTSNNTLWCGCSKVVVVMSTETFEPVNSLVMSEGTGKVYKMKEGPQGVWISFRSSSVVCLFDVQHYVKLLQINYTSLLPTQPSGREEAVYRITSVMVDDDHLWLGNGCGIISIFSIQANVSNPGTHIQQLAKKGRGRSSDKDANMDSGALLSQPVEGELSDSVEVIHTSELDLPVEGSNTPEVSRPNRYYDRRRKTRFGHTLRGEKPTRSNVLSSVYKLSFEASRLIGSARNESVRIILPISCSGPDRYVVSCVTSVGNLDKVMHVWHCASDSSPNQWTFNCFSAASVTSMAPAAAPSDGTIKSDEA